MDPYRENSRPGVSKSELLFEITGRIPVKVHNLHTFIALTPLLSILHRIYHWTYKHFWGFLAIKTNPGFLLLAVLSSEISW